jgi:diguanylate cyclase (GGDEF)-like protein/PAS domain S-box-containing protein
LDLNIEKGAIELPYKPMIRVGTPVFDRLGDKRGIVLVNYLAANLLDLVREASSGTEGHAFMLNVQGYWLLAGDPALEWGFMLGTKNRFSRRFPEVWDRMRESDVGQMTTEDQIFTWQTLYPLLDNAVSSTGAATAFAASGDLIEGRRYAWKLGTHIPADQLALWRDQATQSALMLFLLFSLVALIGSLFLSRARIREMVALRELQFKEKRLRTITAELAEGLVVLDPDGRLIMLNPEAERLLGWDEGSLSGEDFHSLVHQVSRGAEKHDCPILAVSRTKRVHRVEEDRFQRKDGQQIPVAYTTVPMLVDGALSGIIVTFQDITERQRAREELERLANYDSLTGLLNRRETERRLRLLFAQARRYQRPFSVCMVDIDHFKRINDDHGHQAGDEVLRQVGQLLREMTRAADGAGRFGGEEFLLILAETELEGAVRLGELVRQRIGSCSIEVKGNRDRLRVSASIGRNLRILGRSLAARWSQTPMAREWSRRRSTRFGSPPGLPPLRLRTGNRRDGVAAFSVCDLPGLEVHFRANHPEVTAQAGVHHHASHSVVRSTLTVIGPGEGQMDVAADQLSVSMGRMRRVRRSKCASKLEMAVTHVGDSESDLSDRFVLGYGLPAILAPILRGIQRTWHSRCCEQQPRDRSQTCSSLHDS